MNPYTGSKIRRTEGRRAEWPNRWGILSLPALFWLTALFFFPVIGMGLLSLYKHEGPATIRPILTFENYISFFSDPFHVEILGRTLLLGFIVVLIDAFLAYPVAYVLARMRSRWKPLLLLLVIAPLFVSIVIRNLGWMVLLGANGPINWTLLGLGILDSPAKLIFNFTGVVIGLCHTLLPLMIILLTNAIQKIDYVYEEAAHNLGASRWTVFWRIVFPLSRPGLVAGMLLVFTLAISAFTSPALLGGKRVMVMSTFIEQQVRFVLNYAFGAAIAIVLLIVTAALAYGAILWGQRAVKARIDLERM